ncbi:hypothetical protein DFQ09_105198 [Winogradskyella pacifica]|uniref:Uncharacterized protein n=1 Tax=Winogradskyella pacifica TaxID=664642 RepID=A0A3D9MAW5_9FLAO|nr:hypothetical protein [Winogradskyella pacifica]REE16985.1 hypothetical protein DFQ09_105198 [Winogradskyella pacifica]
MSKTTLLHYDKDAEKRFTKSIERVPELLNEVKSIFIAQKVDSTFKLSDLQRGNFVAIFDDYHKKEMNQYLPKADYNKYLQLCGINTDKLAELQAIYKKILDTKHGFYSENHEYWQSIEWRAGKLNPSLEAKMKEAPAKKEYSIDHFLKISKDTYKVNVNPEFFKLYLTNENQAEAMDVVTDQVKLCKRKKDSPATTIKIAGELVKDIDADYKITWNTEKILNIK